MGSFYSWTCGDCGQDEELYCGGGFESLNEPAVVEESQNGSFGPATKALFGNGIPEDWTVFTERAFCECSECDSIISGLVLVIDGGSEGWLTYHANPGACKTCGGELVSWNEKAPLRESDLRRRCEDRAEHGCPACGGTSVTLGFGNWD